MEKDCTYMLMAVSMTANGKTAGSTEKASTSPRLVSTEWASGLLAKGIDGLIKYRVSSLQTEIKSF
jgi:hypothetical protein